MIEIQGQPLPSWSIILLIALAITILFLILINKRYPYLWTVIKVILAAIGFKKKLDQETLDQIVNAAGYSYDPMQDMFYSNMDAWQRETGYCRLYDEGAIISGMIIDCEPVTFEYDGKKWLIEFWKGQYGMTTGCEIGVYYSEDFDLNIPDFFRGTFYQSVPDEDLFPMSFDLKKHGRTLFVRESSHWWLTGFKLGEFSEPSELVMDLSITLKDSAMRNIFINKLLEIGYSKEEIFVYGNTVFLRFDKPRTPQPIARTPATDWVTQRKNELLCKKYQEITAPYDNLLDKMNGILGLAPGTFKQAIRLGRNKKAFAEYKTIKKHIKSPYNTRNTRLKKVSRVYENSKQIPFDDNSRFILMCDCHRGNGSWGDDFSRNRNLYIAALNHYYRNDFTYIEIGDGDELWENRQLSEIINIHRDVFGLMAKFYRENRLYFIFGNHDMEKKNKTFVKKNFFKYYDERENDFVSLFENIECHEGLVLKHAVTGDKIFLTHGHQVDFLNYTAWKVGRFLVRYLWRPLNIFGIKDPTSTAKNYKKKERVEKKLTQWVKREKRMMISGHTHRPMFPEPGEPPYFNGGSCVYPQDITGIEIAEGSITLVKWSVQTELTGQLFIKRDIITGPVKLKEYFS